MVQGMAWACGMSSRTANETGTLGFTDDVSVDRSSRMNCEVHRATLSAQLPSQSTSTQLSMLWLSEEKTEGRKTSNPATTEGGCRKGLAKHHKEVNSAFVDVYGFQTLSSHWMWRIQVLKIMCIFLIIVYTCLRLRLHLWDLADALIQMGVQKCFIHPIFVNEFMNTSLLAHKLKIHTHSTHSTHFNFFISDPVLWCTETQLKKIESLIKHTVCIDVSVLYIAIILQN